MPIRDIDRVVVVTTKECATGRRPRTHGTSRLNFEDLRSQANVFSDASIMAFTPVAMAGGGEPEQVFGQLVSGSFFDLLGAPLAAGRGFGTEDDRDFGARPVTVLSYGLWQRRFGGRPDIVGQGITLNGHHFTVIGVTGEGFRGTHARRRPGSLGADGHVPRGADGARARGLQARGAASCIRASRV